MGEVRENTGESRLGRGGGGGIEERREGIKIGSRATGRKRLENEEEGGAYRDREREIPQDSSNTEARPGFPLTLETNWKEVKSTSVSENLNKELCSGAVDERSGAELASRGNMR